MLTAQTPTSRFTIPAMFWMSLVTACFGLSSAGCRADESLMVDPADRTPVSLDVVRSEPNCATVTVIIGTSSVTVGFPAASVCPRGLSVLSGGTATYVKSSRKLSVPVRVVNRGPEEVQAPIDLLLPKDSATVTAGTTGKGAALNADNIIPAGQPDAGQAMWHIGGTTPLAAGAMTAPRALEFSLPNKATAVRLGILVQGTMPDTAAPVVPTYWGEMLDSTVTVAAPDDPTVRYFRHRFGIAFAATTSGTTIRDVLHRFGATIVGGEPAIGPRGAYIVSAPEPGLTYEAVEALENQLAAEPGVFLAYTETYRSKGVMRSRFPQDGAGSQRTDWFDSGVGTYPWLDIRAPLAWGCENGLYSGNARVRVGVIDLTFDDQQPDFARSQPQLLSPRSSELIPSDELILDKDARSHGTGVTSVMVAEGDNEKGIAGMLWGADLRMYAYGKDKSIGRNSVREFVRYLTNATANNVQVVTTSYVVGRSGKASEVALIKWALQQYLQAGHLFVIASGNDMLVLPISSVATTTDRRLSAVDKAAAQLLTLYPKQILFVAGTTGIGQFYQPSNFWTGGPMVAAPAGAVKVLARTDDWGPAGTMIANGTSYGAPFVAGLAGQLWGMDPTLTATQVSDYILAGAQEPRRNPLIGTMVPARAVQGAPGTIYQIDAYGSLTRLSRERDGTPICGFPVRFVSYQNTLQLVRRQGDTTTIAVANALFMANISVAQGGRLLSVFGKDLATNQSGVFLMNQRGDRLGMLTGIQERRYLERDTADIGGYNIIGPRLYQVTLRPGDGSAPRIIVPLQVAVPGAADVIQNYMDVSPAGDWAGFTAFYTLNGQHLRGAFLVSLRGTGVVKVREEPLACNWWVEYCGSGYYEQVDFSHDGRVATFYMPESHCTLEPPGGCESRTTTVQASMRPTAPGQSTVTLNAPMLIQGRFLQGGYYTPDDVLLNVYEFDDSGCWLTEHLTADLSVQGAQSAGDICGNPGSGSGSFHLDPAMQLRAVR
jgi:hypothetical protein